MEELAYLPSTTEEKERKTAALGVSRSDGFGPDNACCGSKNPAVHHTDTCDVDISCAWMNLKTCQLSASRLWRMCPGRVTLRFSCGSSQFQRQHQACRQMRRRRQYSLHFRGTPVKGQSRCSSVNPTPLFDVCCTQ